VIFDGAPTETEVLDGAPPPGTEIRAPAIVALPESTVLIPPGWRATVDDSGSVVLDREGI
jgi:N-methylhydantoinase A